MKKQLLLIIIITISGLNCFSQITFENGYFIKNNGEKIQCLIKNLDWRNNPSEIEYKLTQDSEIQAESVGTIKEFGIENISKYNSFSVKIDTSSEDVSKLSHSRNPEFAEKQLFLKTLVEGKATLYQYIKGNMERYFFSIDGSYPEQLIFKSYIVPVEKISQNNTYKQQLLNNMGCSISSINDLNTTRYNKSSLMYIFKKYNECENQTFKDYSKSQKRSTFNINIRPGINIASTLVQADPSASYLSYFFDFGSNLEFRLGIEAEYILPFNKNKWSIIFEPTFRSVKSTTDNNTFGNITLNYRSIELPIGIRHYFFFNNNAKLFINAQRVIDITLNSIVDLNRTNNINLLSNQNFAIGLGYKYKAYSFEVRYATNRDITWAKDGWISDYKSISIIFGYSLFNK